MIKAGVALLAVVLAAPTFAIDTRFLKDAPITRLTESELRTFKAFVDKTLDEGADGASAEWKAPKTVFTSQITLTKSFTEGNLKCREATIASRAQDREERGNYIFCKSAKG